MRFDTPQHPGDCGIALPARILSVCRLRQDGEVGLHRTMHAAPAPFFTAIAPSRDARVVAVAWRCTWSWRAELGTQAGLPCVPGQARSLPALQGSKANNDTRDAPIMAVWRRGGLRSQASVTPAGRCATRARVRRRLPRTRHRAALRAPGQPTTRQENLPASGNTSASPASRAGVAARFPAPAVQTRVAVALARLASDDRLRSALAWTLRQTAQPHETLRLVRLHAVPGLGTLWRLGLRDALHAITRCPRVQAFVSSCRLVKGAKESAGKRDGTAGKKSGHAYLTWAFAGAAALLLRHKTQGQKLLAHVEKKHGQGKALPILAPKLARAVYYMLTRATVFEMARFRNGYGSRVGEPATALDTYGISLYYRPGQSATALRHGTRTRP